MLEWKSRYRKENMAQKTNLKYYYYFVPQAVKKFNELFPMWRDVEFPPLEKALINLFSSPIESYDELMNKLMAISQEFSYWELTQLKQKINQVIKTVAKFHNKTFADWENALKEAKAIYIKDAFLAKYPDWRNAELCAREEELLELLYGFKNNEVLSMAQAGKQMDGFSRQLIQERRDKALKKLDLHHETETDTPNRQEFAAKLKKFRGAKSLASMAKYFGVSYGVYRKLENEDLARISSEYPQIFAEALH